MALTWLEVGRLVSPSRRLAIVIRAAYVDEGRTYYSWQPLYAHKGLFRPSIPVLLRLEDGAPVLHTSFARELYDLALAAEHFVVEDAAKGPRRRSDALLSDPARSSGRLDR